MNLLFEEDGGFKAGSMMADNDSSLQVEMPSGKRSKIKDTAYECGMIPIGEGSTRMSVKFYLVAMMFILFDIEVVFMYPWAVVYKAMLQEEATRNMIFGSMVSFLGILFVGYIYAVKKKAFDWKN